MKIIRKIYLLFTLYVVTLFSQEINAQTKTIHIYVALCDNINQGIVPVPVQFGNGQDPRNNLYWGALYGVKSFFKKSSSNWLLIKDYKADGIVLDRLLFKHKTKDVYLLADAYDGAKIKTCTEDLLKAANGQNLFDLDLNGKSLSFGGGADLLGYIGHDGLMDFDVKINYKANSNKRDLILLACYSKDYFKPEVEKSGANPILWTTHLMAPEAYTMKAAIDGWINNESNLAIEERAAQAYNKYQKCGIKGARNLFTTGF